MLEGTIRVYACSGLEQSKYSTEGYYKVEGKLGGITKEWVSDVKLEAGDIDVKLKLSEYQGKLGLRIVSLV